MHDFYRPLRTALVAACLALFAGSASADEGLLNKALLALDEEHATALLEQVEAGNAPQKTLFLGILYHNLMVLDPAKHEAKALQYAKAAAEESAGALTQVILGSVTTLQGEIAVDKGDVVMASAKIDEGFKLMDAAVKGDPDNRNARMFRLANALEVSKRSPFPRYDIAQTDLDYLETFNESYSPGMRSFLQLCAGRLALHHNRVDDAIGLLEKALRLAPQSASGRRAQQFLDELEE